MEKIYRDHIDVQIAFTASAKKIVANLGALSQQNSHIEDTAAKQDLEPMAIENPTVTSLGSRAKKLMRPIARVFYRALKPLVHPLAFRVRHYLFAPLYQEQQRISLKTLQELQEIKKALLQNPRGSPLAALHEDRQQISFNTVQELQVIKEALQQDLQLTSAAIRQEVQKQVNRLQPRLDRIEQYTYASARRIAINCGPDEILVRSEVGYVLCSGSDHAILSCLIDTGELERGTRLLIQAFLQPGDVFVDVGANLGLHTLAAARAMQGRGRIIAFEPFEPTQRLLAKSIWMNGFAEITEIHQAAVSNRAGHQKLFLGATSGHHSLFQLSTPSTLTPPPVEVPLVRLDEVLPPTTAVNLIKIDAEGAELEVLESAEAIIQNNQDIALIVEFGSSHLARTGHTTQDWLSAFQKLGLHYRAINTETGTLEEWSVDQIERVESINLFFARPGSLAWAKAAVAT